MAVLLGADEGDEDLDLDDRHEKVEVDNDDDETDITTKRTAVCFFD